MKNVKITRRSFLLGLGAASSALLLSACGSTDAPASSASTSVLPQPDSGAPASSAASEVPPEPILRVDEFPITDGSTACIPLIAQIMADTTGLDLETARSAVTTNTTAQAWRNLGLYGNNYGDSVKLIIAYEAPESVKEELKADGDPLEQKAIGRDALVFIVNEDNPVQSLTLQQLKDIYAGTITNWKDVGGKDQEIIAFQRRADSGSQTLFQKLLIQGGPLMEAPTELAPTAMGELVDSIAEYNNSANAIGFSVYYYIDQMYSKPGLRLLAVDGVTPSNETIADQSYPLCNEFYAAILQDSAADSPERRIYEWLSTDAGRSCIEHSGYVEMFVSFSRFTILSKGDAASCPILPTPRTPPTLRAAAARHCAATSFRPPPCWRSCCPGWCSSACCSASSLCSSGCRACCLMATM